MATKRQRDFGLGLTGAKMQVVEVVRYRLVEGRQAGIDHQMMVTGVEFFEAGGGERPFRSARNGRSLLA